MAYAADTPALAVLEVLVHLQWSEALAAYSLVSAEIPEGVVEVLSKHELPRNRAHSPVPPEVQAAGDAWVRRGGAAVLQVPSAVVPLATNYLINPAHPDFARIVLGEAHPFTFDSRLLGAK
jgi:RES domain-containing protein